MAPSYYHRQSTRYSQNIKRPDQERTLVDPNDPTTFWNRIKKNRISNPHLREDYSCDWYQKKITDKEKTLTSNISRESYAL